MLGLAILLRSTFPLSVITVQLCFSVDLIVSPARDCRKARVNRRLIDHIILVMKGSTQCVLTSNTAAEYDHLYICSGNSGKDRQSDNNPLYLKHNFRLTCNRIDWRKETIAMIIGR